MRCGLGVASACGGGASLVEAHSNSRSSAGRASIGGSSVPQAPAAATAWIEDGEREMEGGRREG